MVVRPRSGQSVGEVLSLSLTPFFLFFPLGGESKMPRKWYLKTSNPEVIVAVDRDTGEISLIKGEVNPFTTCANVLKSSVMKEIRRIVKERGLCLREPERVFTARGR